MCKIQMQNFEGSELSVNPNEDVSLNCTVVQGAPASTITWSKEGNDSNGQRILTVQSESNPGLWSSLNINNVMVKNAGRYKCEVKKDVFEDVCEVTLHVYCKFVRTTQYDKLLHLSLVMIYLLKKNTKTKKKRCSTHTQRVMGIRPMKYHERPWESNSRPSARWLDALFPSLPT